MRPFTFLIILTTTFLITISCKESITDSRPRIIRPPQEMIWVADTIKAINDATQLLPFNLLVFSANDAWLTCWSDIARGLIWHFDGKSWTESNIAADVGGMRVKDINGYSSNNLWSCGYTGDEIFLAHYDGSHWTKYNTNGIKGELLKMCKDAEGNLWACGRNGLIMKYDRTNWTSSYAHLPVPLKSNQFFKSIREYAGEIYLIASTITLNDLVETYYYVKGNMNKWTIVDSMRIDSPIAKIKWGNFNLFSTNGSNLYSVGLQGCWKLNDNSWEKVFSHNGELYDISGPNNNYLITCSAFKTLKYYNGSGWIDFSLSLNVNEPYFRFINVSTNGYETFIVGYLREDRLIVWRGK